MNMNKPSSLNSPVHISAFYKVHYCYSLDTETGACLYLNRLQFSSCDGDHMYSYSTVVQRYKKINDMKTSVK